ncbi:methionyl-tRNA formyltransferase [Desulfovibrio litoralis]|uniref:Methionyl-tRNA formyltransferase n=1 Tax=Desulfovibrio litoralis DSM 11393 TaxID=1121455 RepID=A0A1M7RVJ0_9BACT|nr:methionyl-tRNA formyltransferase [Desulfovibrio litoralis]SHN50022.1 methionyl-tRNA formyltransferase [Desulfovibrio litoralis DSM 11393]
MPQDINTTNITQASFPQKSRIVFMGTPQLAATILDKLINWQGGEIIAVYTQPDRPAGRGYSLKASEVKTLALKHKLSVYQPLNFKNHEDIKNLAAFKPDFLIVAAYGLILPQAVLDIPKYLPINVHTSLLPFYRGAAPIQRAVMNAEVVSGITIMKMEAGLDTGPILLQKALAIGINETAGTLHDQMAELGAELLIEALEKIKQGKIQPLAQDNTKASYAAKLSKEDGLINFNQKALKIHAHIRGVTPYPGAFAFLTRDDEPSIKVNFLAGEMLNDSTAYNNYIALNQQNERPKHGTILGLENDKLAVVCQDKIYLIPQLQPAGKKIMSAVAFYNGYLAKFKHCRFSLT